MKTKNSKYIAIKQLVAFIIDLFLVSLVLIINPSLENYYVFVFLWFVYIPMAEFYFSQTIGMKIVGTYIYTTSIEKHHIKFGTAARRHIARIGMVWGIFGWFLMFISKPYKTDYVISDGKNYSIESNVKGLVRVHKNNQYKVILFAFVLMALFTIAQKSF